jgi:hypothetical protein
MLQSISLLARGGRLMRCILLLAIAFTVTGCGQSEPPAKLKPVVPSGPLIGTTAPDIVGTNVDGKLMMLRDYRGKVVVLSFWADF